jgi:hypothetical protein
MRAITFIRSPENFRHNSNFLFLFPLTFVLWHEKVSQFGAFYLYTFTHLLFVLLLAVSYGSIVEKSFLTLRFSLLLYGEKGQVVTLNSWQKEEKQNIKSEYSAGERQISFCFAEKRPPINSDLVRCGENISAVFFQNI